MPDKPAPTAPPTCARCPEAAVPRRGTQPVNADAIDALLPQTQCTRCGYSGCRPYAEAIAAGEAAINQCPPGGAATIEALARLTGLPALPLNPTNGVEQARKVAFILEEHCIGCTKCLPACPVDAIIGASKRMHTVIVAECTGCELCIAPCPVDCIVLVADSAADGAPRGPIEASEAAHFRQRHAAHITRAERRRADQVAKIETRREALRQQSGADTLAEVIARARARRASGNPL
ncbi:MAG: RnfABCDGE type electron transport complex subunit B [Xanthomonadales bacterium]|nr:RnfABCDGE type electron transport complex subunit B [Xanthomonadales bacterium]